MSRRLLASLISVCALGLGSVGQRNVSHAAAASSAPRVIGGVVPSQVAKGQAQLLGPESGSTSVNLAIGLPARDPAALNAFLQDVSDPSSPRYQQYLTQSQANALFNPTAADQERVSHWLTAHGFMVSHTYPNHLVVDASGTVSQAQKLFGVSVNRYRATIHGHQQVFFAPSSDAVVDSSVSDVVNSVVGLDDIPRFHLLSNGTATRISRLLSAGFRQRLRCEPALERRLYGERTAHRNHDVDGSSLGYDSVLVRDPYVRQHGDPCQRPPKRYLGRRRHYLGHQSR